MKHQAAPTQWCHCAALILPASFSRAAGQPHRDLEREQRLADDAFDLKQQSGDRLRASLASFRGLIPPILAQDHLD